MSSQLYYRNIIYLFNCINKHIIKFVLLPFIGHLIQTKFSTANHPVLSTSVSSASNSSKASNSSTSSGHPGAIDNSDVIVEEHSKVK